MSRASSATKTRVRRPAPPSSASAPTRDPELAKFVRASGAVKQGPRTIAVCFYLEEIQGVRPLTPSLVRRAYLSIPLRPPENLPRLLKRLADDGLLVRLHRDRANYILSDSARSSFGDPPLSSGSPDPLQDVAGHLRQEARNITDKDEKACLDEAIACLGVNALRAAVVMGWTAAMWNLRRKALAGGLAAFNAEFRRRWPQSKKRPVQSISGFEDHKDDEFLQVIEGMGIVSKSVLAELLTHLKLRNGCGHPTAVRPKINRVAGFFEDILQYVLTVT